MKKNIIMVVLALVLSVSTLFFAGTPVQAHWRVSLRHFAGRPDADAVGQEYYFVCRYWRSSVDSCLCDC